MLDNDTKRKLNKIFESIKDNIARNKGKKGRRPIYKKTYGKKGSIERQLHDHLKHLKFKHVSLRTFRQLHNIKPVNVNLEKGLRPLFKVSEHQYDLFAGFKK